MEKKQYTRDEKITVPGRYRVRVKEVDRNAKTRAGAPMLVVTFQDSRTGKFAFGQFADVQRNVGVAKALGHLKAALGLFPDSRANDFVGRECEIVLIEQVNKPGFYNITNYLPVDAAPQKAYSNDDELPY